MAPRSPPILDAKPTAAPSSAWLGDSEMGRRVAAFDWSTTALGAIETWPHSLTTAVAICLHSRFQMAIYWGPELICIYNDAERDVLGHLHPSALGLPARELLRDSWDVLEPQLTAVMEHGRTTFVEDHPLRFDRRGLLEVGYFTYSYSPIRDDHGGVGGVLLVSEETTGRVLAERRMDALRELAARSMDVPSDRHACMSAAQAFHGHPDVPFCLLYLVDEDGGSAACAAASAASGVRYARIDMGSGRDGPATVLRAAIGPASRGTVAPADLFLAPGPSGASRAFVQCIRPGATQPPVGFLVAGISDEIAFDDAYEGFLGLVALGVGRSVSAARARQAEPTGAHASGGDRVLLVEGNADMREYLQRLLAPHYCVETAPDGSQALQMALADPPAIVISDVVLPGLDGVGLIEWLRRDHRTRSVPVILVSARAERDSALRALDVGADDYISRPFGARELLARVRATLHGARLRTLAGETRGRAQERAHKERELHALLTDLKAAHERVAAAGDAERRRIERDLHDGAQQRLMALRLELGLLAERVDDDQVVTRTELDRLRGEVEGALEELREIAHGLHPPLLASDGLFVALSAAARRAPLPVDVEGADIGRLAPAVENAAYFCCLEALQNVAKHAGPGARAAIRLEVRHGALDFSVADDGQGFDQRAATTGHGLMNLHDRLGALGGHAEVTSIPGRGTTVVGHIPLPSAATVASAGVRTTPPGDADLPIA